jgi:hypothetical protein
MRQIYEKPTPAKVPFELPTKEEFQVWCESNVTQFVALAYKIGADLQKEDWMNKSWESGQTDPLILMQCKTREDAYLAFIETEYEAYVKVVTENV